jgi:hypothetical protein
VSEKPEPRRPAPFATLLATGSLVLAVLLVAGFSYRWAYYYNFGLKDLAIQAPVQSIAISALELIRTPSEAWRSLLIVGVPMAVLSLLISLIQRLTSRYQTVMKHWPWSALISMVIENQLVIDIVRAIVLIYAAFWAGSEAGYQKFMVHIIESPANTLPTVTVVISDKAADRPSAISCTQADWSASPLKQLPSTPIVGSSSTIKAFREGLGCNVRGYRTWRLLYRDEKFTYLFVTGKGVARPTTLILQSGDPYLLILQGPEGDEIEQAK